MRRRKLPVPNVTIQNTISAKALEYGTTTAFGKHAGRGDRAFARNLWAILGTVTRLSDGTGSLTL